REILAGTTVLASERARELGVEGVALSSAFDSWFARCTAYEPADRFPTASEAVGALAAALSVATMIARTVAPGRVPSIRPAQPPSGAGAAVETPRPVPPASSVPVRDASDRRDLSSGKPRRVLPRRWLGAGLAVVAVVLVTLVVGLRSLGRGQAR